MLWVNLIMDTLGALALATEPPHEGLMKRPPVGRDAKFITRIMWRNIVGQSIFQILVLLIFQLKGKQLLNLTGSDADSILKTFIFNSFVFCQVWKQPLPLFSIEAHALHICTIYSTYPILCFILVNTSCLQNSAVASFSLPLACLHCSQMLITHSA